MHLSPEKGLICCLLNRAWNILSNTQLFEEEVNKLRVILANNSYPRIFFNNNLQSFLSRSQTNEDLPLIDTPNEPESKKTSLNTLCWMGLNHI